jgi:hypothetical protein
VVTQVSFLLEVYGQLEEPDGLVGLAAMRPGGLSTADQVIRLLQFWCGWQFSPILTAA